MSNALSQSKTAVSIGAKMADDYLETLNKRSVIASSDALERLKVFDGDMPEIPSVVIEMLKLLNTAGPPATTPVTERRVLWIGCRRIPYLPH